jgi:uncharacterized protein
MRVTITGATGLIGTQLVHALTQRGDEVTVLSRSPEKAADAFSGSVRAHRWDPMADPAPVEALTGRDAVVHLAGENVAQRWTDEAKQRILASREVGTRNLVAGIGQVPEGERPGQLVASSAVGYYGKHGDEELTEATPAGSDFLANVCVVWERESDRAAELGLKVAKIRTGVVLDASGGALGKQLLPFKLGVGGPVAGGRQYLPWISTADIVGLYVAALDGGWDGVFNGSAPEPVTNKQFGKALGRALHRPAVSPIPGFAIRLLFGEMAEMVTEGQRAVPAAALQQGHRFQDTDLDEALRKAVAK